MSGIVCSGNVRIAYVDADGVPTGAYIGVVNATNLTLTVPAPTVLQRVSKQNETFGQALDLVNFPKPMDVQLDTDDVGDSEILAWAVGGLPAGFTQAGGTITAEALTASLGKWLKLANRSVSAFTLTGTSGTPTYVSGTDYLLDPVAGFVKILAGGAITDALALKANYTAAALTGTAVSVGNRSSITVRIEGDMINLANNQRVHVVVPKAVLAPAGGLDFMGANFLVASMKGNAVVVGSQAPATVTAIT